MDVALRELGPRLVEVFSKIKDSTGCILSLILLHAATHTHTHARTHARTHAHTHTHTHTNTHTHTHTHTQRMDRVL